MDRERLRWGKEEKGEEEVGHENRDKDKEGEDDDDQAGQARIERVWDGEGVDIEENLECASDAGALKEHSPRPTPYTHGKRHQPIAATEHRWGL